MVNLKKKKKMKKGIIHVQCLSHVFQPQILFCDEWLTESDYKLTLVTMSDNQETKIEVSGQTHSHKWHLDKLSSLN